MSHLMNVFIETRLAAGQTLRYHTVPRVGRGQNVAEHSWRAAVLMHTLWPDRVNLKTLLEVLYHDAAEQELGDIPAPAKWRYPEMYKLYEKAEREQLEALAVKQDLNAEESQMVRIVDMLECLTHVSAGIIEGNHSLEALTIYWNSRRALIRNFDALPIFAPVREYMNALHGRVVRNCPDAANTTD